MKLFLTSSLLLFSSTVFSNSHIPTCSSSIEFCRSEFVSLISSKDQMSDMISSLPQHIRHNLSFKRGNNMNKYENSTDPHNTGLGFLGPHGHKVSPRNSSSATPDQPRVFVWDEKTGFTATWNSGNPNHGGHDRVDIYSFDFSTNQHELAAWQPKLNQSSPLIENFADSKGTRCTSCHGAVKRPIWPMYPDWPQIYGEFNDEMDGYLNRRSTAIRSDLGPMGNDFQARESQLYQRFIRNEGRTNPRYTPLFENKNRAPRDRSYATDHQHYPYRPLNAAANGGWNDTSRAFYHRPNLRLGVLYNRLTALQTFEKIKSSTVFQKFPDVMLYSILDCNWTPRHDLPEASASRRKKVFTPLLAFARNQGINTKLQGPAYSSNELTSAERQQMFQGTVNGSTRYYRYPEYDNPNQSYTQIPYEDLLKLLGLDIKDLDIRYKYNTSMSVSKNNNSYNLFDEKAFYLTESAMDLGYIEPRYRRNPICNRSNRACNFTYQNTYMDGMKYFNSYFDGSATTNELLAAQMFNYLVGPDSSFEEGTPLHIVSEQLKISFPNPDAYYETFRKKYARRTARFRLDEVFFDRMDAISPWIQLPYPEDLLWVHNRESFWGEGAESRHAQWSSLNNRQRGNGANRTNGVNNICWSVYSSIYKRSEAGFE